MKRLLSERSNPEITLQSIVKEVFTDVLKYSIKPSNSCSLLLLRHGKVVSYTIKYQTTIIQCHLILLTKYI